MTIQEAQEKVDRWIREYGVRYFSELTNLALLMEETGELARLMARRYGEQSSKSTEPDKDLADEMADILFVLLCLANQTGIDLNHALELNILKKTYRDDERHHSNPKLG
jgi:NTP pyrophosphatase (non-canonical NTP hydrolase)